MNPLMLPEATLTTARTALSVNVNKVALLRNTRALTIPSVTRAATIALEAGAAGITVHPRPDERHIRAADVHDLAAWIVDWPRAEYNIEGNPFHNLMDFVRAVRPHQCTFVPDEVGAGHQRPWLGPRRRRRAVASADRRGARPRRPRQPVHGSFARTRWPPCATSAPSASSCTPRAGRSAWHTPRHDAVLQGFRSAAGSRAGQRSRHQRGSRPQPRQPHRLPRGGARRSRGLDRPCADRRCARVRTRGHGREVSRMHRTSWRPNG